MKLEPSQLLRFVCLLLVATVFVIAGVSKISASDPGMTMVGRYLPSPQAVKGLGFAEIGIALWLLSLKTPRLSAAVTLATLLAFTVMIVLELNRNAPLPCGCLEVRPGASPHAIRNGLLISVGRNAVLMVLTALTIALAGDGARGASEDVSVSKGPRV